MREELLHLLDVVRRASAEGRLVPLADVWQGSADELRAALVRERDAGAEPSGLAIVGQDANTYVYSEDHMTEAYAAAAALALEGDDGAAIAEIVRRDSATYPRPTPLDVFGAPPFLLSPGAVQAAIDAFALDARYADLEMVQASDGTRFLFSTRHLTAAHARSLADWFAVGQFENQ